MISIVLAISTCRSIPLPHHHRSYEKLCVYNIQTYVYSSHFHAYEYEFVHIENKRKKPKQGVSGRVGGKSESEREYESHTYGEARDKAIAIGYIYMQYSSGFVATSASVL